MRTTITLDSDVEALLQKLMTERGLTFKDAVNGLLRDALIPASSKVDYSFHTYDMGEPAVPLEHALRVAAELEDEEILRKLSVGR
ncbi:MAG: antitoxin [Nakamurella sp.]